MEGEIGFQGIVALALTGDDAVAWIQLEPPPDSKWQALFYGLSGYAGAGRPPMLRADGQVTVCGSVGDDGIGRAIDALREDVVETNAAYRRDDPPRRRSAPGSASITAADSSAVRARLSARLLAL